jgi:hypothetical protein
MNKNDDRSERYFEEYLLVYLEEESKQVKRFISHILGVRLGNPRRASNKNGHIWTG